MTNKKSLTPKDSSEITDAIAKGAVGIAITAGVIAAGIAFMDKENRKKAAQTTKAGLTKISEIASVLLEEPEDRYRIVASQIPSVKKNTSKSTISKVSKK